MSGVVRLIDIAERLKLDKSTVSLALRNHPRIPAKTRERIHAMATQMGYRRDPALARLAARRWAGKESLPSIALALVAERRSDYPLQREELGRHLAGWCASSGYGWELIFAEDYRSSASLKRVLRARGVAGVVLLPTSASRPVWSSDPEERWWEEFAAVRVLSGVRDIAGVPVVLHDTVSTILDAGRRVLRLGARRAALVLIRQTVESWTDTLDAAVAARVVENWRAAGLDFAELVFCDLERNGMERVAKWLRDNRVDAAVMQNCGFHWHLRELGVIAGRDLRALSLHNVNCPGWAGYDLRLEDVARLVVQRLDAMVRHDERGWRPLPEVTLVPGAWLPGGGWE